MANIKTTHDDVVKNYPKAVNTIISLLRKGKSKERRALARALNWSYQYGVRLPDGKLECTLRAAKGRWWRLIKISDVPDIVREDAKRVFNHEDSVTVHIPKKTFEFLKNFMHEVNTQDNRITASPYYYVLRYPDVDDEGCKVEKYVKYGQNVFLTEKAAKRYIEGNAHNLPKGVYTYLDHAYRNPELMGILDAIGEVTGLGHDKK